RPLPEALEVTSDLLAKLEAAPWAPAELEAALRELATAKGWSAKEVFMMLRALVTGKTASPPLLASLVVLGRARTLDRIRRLLEARPQAGPPRKENPPEV